MRELPPHGRVGNVVPLKRDTSSRSQQRLESVFREQETRLLNFLVLRLGSQAEAEDVAQTVFLRLWQQVEELRDENLIGLLFVTARNTATDLLRQRTRQAASIAMSADTEHQAELLQDQTASPYRILAGREHLTLVRRLLDELPPKCRAAFMAYKFEGLSYPEIAESMGVTESMIRKHVLRALAHCAARFEQWEGWE